MHDTSTSPSSPGTAAEVAQRPRPVRPWLRCAYGVLLLAATCIWFWKGPLQMFVCEYEPDSSSWPGYWLVIDHRFWWTTGTVEFYQGIGLWWHWSQPLFWSVHLGGVVLARRLHASRRAQVVLIALPVLLGQALNVATYYLHWI